MTSIDPLKKKVESLSGQLRTDLENCIKAVNYLIDFIEKYLPGQRFEKIVINIELSLKEICKLIIELLNEIKRYLNPKAKDLERLIGTGLYKQLKSPDTTYHQKIAIAQNVVKVNEGISYTVEEISCIGMAKTGGVVCIIPPILGKLAESTLASLALRNFGFPVDMIIPATLGNIDNHQHQTALEEYTMSVETFKPVSEELYHMVHMMQAAMELTHKG